MSGGFDGNGNYNRFYNWESDAANGIDISADRMDTEHNGFAAALSNAVTRDGQGKMEADFLPNTDNELNLGNGTYRWSNINGIPISSFLTSINGTAVGQAIYPRTLAESNAGVVPTNYIYPELNVLRYGTNTNPGTTDMTTAINNAIAVAKQYLSNAFGSYLTGAFAQVVATVVFPKGRYLYAGTIDFTNVYSYCNLYFDGDVTLLHTTNLVCIDIGNGVTDDVCQVKLYGGKLTIARATKDSGSIGIRMRGAHSHVIQCTVNLWGMEKGLQTIGCEEIDLDFHWGAIGNVTTAIEVNVLASFNSNNVQIRNVFCWGGGGSNTSGNFLKLIGQGGVGSGAAGGVISLKHCLVQGIDPVGGTCIQGGQTGETAGFGTLNIDNCWFEEAGRTYFDVYGSNWNIKNSFITLYNQSGTSDIFKLEDTTSLISLENVEMYFDDTATIRNSSIVNRAAGTVTGIANQLEATRTFIKNGGSTQFVTLLPNTNGARPQQTFFYPKIQRIQFSFAAPKYPSAITDEYSSNLALNLTTLVKDVFGDVIGAGSGFVDVVLHGSDGASGPGHAWYRGYIQGGGSLINWISLDNGASPYTLTPSGSGSSYVVTFPATQGAWYRTQADITLVTR